MKKVILIIVSIFFSYIFMKAENKDLLPELKALDISAEVYARKGVNGRFSVNIEIFNKGSEKIIIPNMLPSVTANIYIKVYDNLGNLLIEQSEDFLDERYYVVLNKGEDLKVSIPLYTQYRSVELANMIARSRKVVMELCMFASFPSAKSFNQNRIKHMIVKELVIDPIHFDDDHLPDPGDDNR